MKWYWLEWSYKPITEPADEIIPKQTKKAKQKWMTEETLSMMDERKHLKRNEEEYKNIDKIIKEKWNKAKE